MRQVVINITVMLTDVKKYIKGGEPARLCDLCQVADRGHVAPLPQPDVLAGHAHEAPELRLRHVAQKPDYSYAVHVIFYRHG
jgi:hypothetical protein